MGTSLTRVQVCPLAVDVLTLSGVLRPSEKKTCNGNLSISRSRNYRSLIASSVGKERLEDGVLTGYWSVFGVWSRLVRNGPSVSRGETKLINDEWEDQTTRAGRYSLFVFHAVNEKLLPPTTPSPHASSSFQLRHNPLPPFPGRLPRLTVLPPNSQHRFLSVRTPEFYVRQMHVGSFSLRNLRLSERRSQQGF